MRARLEAVVVLALVPGDVAAVVLACFLFRVGALPSAVCSERRGPCFTGVVCFGSLRVFADSVCFAVGWVADVGGIVVLV